MIENIRKYSGLMIVVLVVVFISFFFMDTQSMRGMTGAPPVIKIDGRGYSEKDFRRGGSGSYEIIGGAMQLGDFGLYQAFIPLLSRATSQEDVAKQLFVGRKLLGEAKKEFGIHPSDEEVSSYLRKMRMFAGPDGAFDAEKYRNFIERGIGHLGMTENDLREIASDAIVSEKLQAILGAGLGADRGTVAANLALENQQVTVELGKLDLDSYQSKIDPKEEEIKAFWEGVQDSFKTEPLRKFTYVLVTPAAVAEAAAEPTKESIADATASDEVKAAAKKAEDEKKAAAAAKVAEERRKEQTKTDSLVDDFLYELEQKKGVGFEELAKKNGWEVKTTELFPLSKPAPGLDINLRASSQGTKAADELFKIRAGSDAFSKISEAIPVGEGQWLVARLDGEEASRVKTYAEARADARAQYISEKGIEALKAAAEAASTKIKESVTAGKSFAEAAKEAGIPETKTVEKVTRTYRPDAITEPRNLFEAVKTTDPGSLTAPIVESDRAFVVYVVKREVVKEPNAEARLDAELKNQSGGNQLAAFDSWLSSRMESAKIETLYK
jgi:peptidyl-prolyl cis-trans isomerase D